jgi:hypothetical protein
MGNQSKSVISNIRCIPSYWFSYWDRFDLFLFGIPRAPKTSMLLHGLAVALHFVSCICCLPFKARVSQSFCVSSLGPTPAPGSQTHHSISSQEVVTPFQLAPFPEYTTQQEHLYLSFKGMLIFEHQLISQNVRSVIWICIIWMYLNSTKFVWA